MPRSARDQTTRDDARHLLPAPPSTDAVGLPPGARHVTQPGQRRLSRRALLSVAVSAVLLAACKKEQIVYVERPTPVPAPPTPAPPPPTPAPKPEAKPAVPTPNQGPIQLPIAVPAGAMAAQSQVLPALQLRSRPYTNRLQTPERLQIPSIDLDAKVVTVGTKTDPQGHLLWETAAFAIGHHKGSALPGENGNVVLSGHISSPREGAVFNKLPNVKAGDGIVIGTAERQYLYVVAETRVVTPDAVEVLDPTDHAILTLLTCVPDGIYSHRLVVRAEAV
jgi:LPXTG-site transpeptidase (sortase) family protein